MLPLSPPMLSILLHFNFAFNFNAQLYIKEGAEPEPGRVKFDRHAPRARLCTLSRRNQLSPVLKAPESRLESACNQALESKIR